jgi:peptide deformylase
MKRILASTAGLIMAGTASVMAAPPASAQPVVTGGVVNVTVTDVIDDVTVTIQDINVGVGAALGLAANVCDVNVNVLATQLRNEAATCTSEATGQTVTIDQV